MLALDFLRATFTDGVLFGVKVTRIRTPLVGVVVRQTERIEPLFQLEEHFITSIRDKLDHHRQPRFPTPQAQRRLLGLIRIGEC